MRKEIAYCDCCGKEYEGGRVGWIPIAVKHHEDKGYELQSMPVDLCSECRMWFAELYSFLACKNNNTNHFGMELPLIHFKETKEP